MAIKYVKNKMEVVNCCVLASKSYVIQALELHGCTFPASPLPHPDNDQWKHTMFTNLSFYFRGCHVKITGKL